MNSQGLFETSPYHTWTGPPFEWDHTPAVHLPNPQSSDSGHAKRLASRSGQSLLDENYDLFDTEVVDKFLFNVVYCPSSVDSKDDYTSSVSFCGMLEAEGTSPPATGARTKVISDTSSPMTEVVIDIPGERRRAQNRAAQRAHRERQKRYVAQLEKRFFALQANYNHLDEKYKKVEREHQSLMRMLSRQIPATPPVAQANMDSFLSVSSNDPLAVNEFLLCDQEPEQTMAEGIDGVFSKGLGVP
ncbi:hypothetical protein FOPE_12324 [Fonsecaea pedrosoi]|nr:hypothetical protein FOPE_12324 [Fonsecaea pedrosoi]